VVVKNLYMSGGAGLRSALVLQGLSREMATWVLLALQNLFLQILQSSGSIPEAFGPFITARRLSDRPIAARHWGSGKEDVVKDDR